MKPRWILLSGILVSCTFPSVTYDEGGLSDATIDTFVDDTSTDDVNDGGIPEAQDDGNDPCDQDHDGYRALTCEGGTDCNDNDPNVNPGITTPNFNVPDAFPYGDWNCDGKVVPVYPAITCNLGCSASQGFDASVGCGLVGGLETCKSLAVCSYTAQGPATQGCL
jgi:hypothetical protein